MVGSPELLLEKLEDDSTNREPFTLPLPVVNFFKAVLFSLIY